MKRFATILSLFVVVFAAVAVAADEDKMLTSGDKTLRCQLPEGWAISDDNKDADRLQIKNDAKECYMLFLSDAKADLDTNIKQYSEDRRDAMLQKLDNAKSSDAKQIAVGTHKAYQYEITGTVKDGRLRLKYLVTIFETEDRYVQCVGWSVASKFDDDKTELEKATDGFRDNAKK